MGPHADDLDGPLRFEDLIDEAVLDVGAAGESTGEIAGQFFVRRGIAERVIGEDGEKIFDFRPESGCGGFFGVALRLLGVDDLPLPAQVFGTGFHGRFQAAADRFAHSRDGEQVKRFFDGAPVLLRDQNAIGALAGDKNRLVRLRRFIEQAIESSTRLTGV